MLRNLLVNVGSGNDFLPIQLRATTRTNAVHQIDPQEQIPVQFE